ncbi:hypothetical protein KFK09_009161 [Dendrobium nobile]|uniref:Secreted protein n=1 Tax=Dendrobium nobile TaxID=94219 RepID=A0A8T3BRM1_DENNO|nr:hypothetical protein KFK09_009161 [Dendrobium nobile]
MTLLMLLIRNLSCCGIVCLSKGLAESLLSSVVASDVEEEEAIECRVRRREDHRRKESQGKTCSGTMKA